LIPYPVSPVKVKKGTAAAGKNFNKERAGYIGWENLLNSNMEIDN
jgi:hypothetical protein